MIRKNMILVALATTLAAGSAFAGSQVTGTVAKVDTALGYVWLDNGVKYDVGTDFAHGVLPGNGVSLIVMPNGTDFEVISAQPAGL